MEKKDSLTISEYGAPFKTDNFGRIKLTQEMRDAAIKAEHDFEEGKCYTEADFN
jgi:hypothetical protein